MKIAAREVFESGKKVGVLYEPACTDVDPEDLDVRVLQGKGHRFRIQDAGVREVMKGKWDFTKGEFRSLGKILERWDRETRRFGGYRTERVGGCHSVDIYQPSGLRSDEVELDDDWDDSVRRVSVPAARRGTPPAHARYVNERGHVVAQALRWDEKALYWLRDEMALVRGRTLTPRQEDWLVDSALFGIRTRGSNVVMRSMAGRLRASLEHRYRKGAHWLCLGPVEICYLSEVAELAVRSDKA